MIRFIDIEKQRSLERDEFCFWDTVNNSFINFGGEYFFFSYSDFWMYYRIEKNELIPSEYNRFLSKIPDKYKQ